MTNSPRLIFSYPNLASVQNYVLRLKHSTKANKKIFAQNKQKKIFEQNKQKNIRTKQTKKYSNKTNKKIFEQKKIFGPGRDWRFLIQSRLLTQSVKAAKNGEIKNFVFLSCVYFHNKPILRSHRSEAYIEKWGRLP
jgi:hypothetical protein